MSCHVMSCHVMSCHVMSCHVMSCHVMSCHVMSCHVMSCHVMSCHVMSCHVMSCHVMSCHAMPCHAMPFYVHAGYTCWYSLIKLILNKISQAGQHFGYYNYIEILKKYKSWNANLLEKNADLLENAVKRTRFGPDFWKKSQKSGERRTTPIFSEIVDKSAPLNEKKYFGSLVLTASDGRVVEFFLKSDFWKMTLCILLSGGRNLRPTSRLYSIRPGKFFSAS